MPLYQAAGPCTMTYQPGAHRHRNGDSSRPGARAYTIIMQRRSSRFQVVGPRPASGLSLSQCQTARGPRAVSETFSSALLVKHLPCLTRMELRGSRRRRRSTSYVCPWRLSPSKNRRPVTPSHESESAQVGRVRVGNTVTAAGPWHRDGHDHWHAGVTSHHCHRDGNGDRPGRRPTVTVLRDSLPESASHGPQPARTRRPLSR